MLRSRSALTLPACGVFGLLVGAYFAFGLPDPSISIREQAAAKLEMIQIEVAATQSRIDAINLKIYEVESRPVKLNLGDPLPEKQSYELGRKARAEEVLSWDIDVRADGSGLPEGSGDVWTGEEVFAENCAACHGDFGEAIGRWPVLAGGHETLIEENPVKTIGSYWPYLSTVYDYVYRAMPFGYSQSLSHDDVYAITAYLLYLNDLVDDDFELNYENFKSVRLPNENNFYLDDRATTEHVAFAVQPCMSNCKAEVEITARARIVDVTPDEEQFEVTALAGTSSVASPGDAKALLVDAGEKVFRKCKSCHAIGAGAKMKSGPHLTEIIGRKMGSATGFGYSSAFKSAAQEDRVWDEAAMAAFLAKPKAYMPGTKMGFVGLKKADDIDAVIAYLKEAG